MINVLNVMNLKYCYVGEEFQQVNWSVPPPPSLGVSVQPTSATNIDEEKQRREGTKISALFVLIAKWYLMYTWLANNMHTCFFFYFVAFF